MKNGLTAWQRLVLFFRSRLRSTSAYDLADGVEDLIKSETGGLGINELRQHVSTVPDAPPESTVNFVERWAREQELSEQQKGSLDLGHEVNKAYEKRGR